MGRLRVGRGVRAPHTRAAFHFLVVSAAGVAHLAWGRPAAVLFALVSLVATAGPGVLANLLFPAHAVVGYPACRRGDPVVGGWPGRGHGLACRRCENGHVARGRRRPRRPEVDRTAPHRLRGDGPATPAGGGSAIGDGRVNLRADTG